MALKKVLLAYDGSTDNGPDLEWGLNFVNQASISTVIVKVFGPPDAFDGKNAVDEKETSGNSQRKKFAAILNKIMAAFKDREFSATTTVTAGDPNTELISCAEKEQVDLIICGAKGVGALASSPAHGSGKKHEDCQHAPRHIVYSVRAVRASRTG